MNLHSDGFMPVFPIKPLVLVGVCAAGKTTVSGLLRNRGIIAKPVAQEHSRVPDLYKRTGDWVVLLAATWETVHRRRRLSWDTSFYRTEWDRLGTARQEACLIVHTDWLTAEQVAQRVARWFDGKVGLDALWRRHPEYGEADRALLRAALQSAVE